MRKSPTIAPKSCESCGAIYTPAGTFQRFCTECAAKRREEAKRAYIQRKFPDRKPKVKCNELCCVCNGPFMCHFDGKPYCNTHYQRMRLYGTPDRHVRKRTNTYVANGDVVTVTVKDGRTFVVDSADLELVQRYSWCFSKTGYLVANIGGKVTKLHRYLLNPPPDVVVDHINGDPADNRRSNLRLCRSTDNARNSASTKAAKSGHQGVRVTPNGRYEARICVNRRTVSLGTYDTIDEAIEARREGEARYFGEFAPSVSRE